MNSLKSNENNSNSQNDKYHYHPIQNDESNDQHSQKDKSNNPLNDNNKKGQNLEVINFTTYIELDMHSLLPKFKDIFDWIPIIRDIIFKSVDKKINYVCFIPGIASHSKTKYKSSLRPLVFLTVKYLGFDCYIDEDNNGVIICDVSQYDNDKITVDKTEILYKVRKSGIYSLSYKQEAEFQENVLETFQQRFPKMPINCSLIICSGRNLTESIEYATNFLNKIHLNETVNENRIENRQKLIEEMKTVKQLKKEYNLDQEIIERVVHEKQNCLNDIEIILNKIINEVPNDFYIHLTDFIIIYDHIPIETILDVMKDKNYNTVLIAQILNDKSMQSIIKSLQILDINSDIYTKRIDGLPAFLPAIEIDLTKTGPQKAIKTVSRIMDGLADGPFSEIDLCFDLFDKSKCKPDQVLPALEKKAADNKYEFDQIHSKYKINGYHFLLSNDKVEHIAYFNKLIAFNAENKE